MTLSTRIAPHLPYLRRFSRAVTGSQTSGDAYVAATLEALIAEYRDLDYVRGAGDFPPELAPVSNDERGLADALELELAGAGP